MKNTLALLCIFLLTAFTLSAQNEVNITKTYLSQNSAKEHLSKSEIDEMTVSSSYLSPTTGWYHVYFTQTYQSIEVYNGVLNATLQNGEVKYVGNTFVPNIASFIPESTSSSLNISPSQAIETAAKSKNLTFGKALQVNSVFINDDKEKGILKASYTDKTLSDENIVVKKYWLPYESTENGKTRKKVSLTWNVQFLTKDHQNQWNIHVDVNTGKILRDQDDIIHCHFEVPENTTSAKVGNDKHTHLKTSKVATPNSYNVFDYPLESPNHGNRTIVINPYARFVPANTGPGATNGWHNDGTTDFTTTRGNNVFAKDDLAFDNEGTIGSSPSSATLEFDSPYSQTTGTAAANLDAAITNLFYWNNVNHDILYRYGFDEPSGNFQQDNMGRGGSGNDYVNADAQDGSTTNNAYFFTPIDGSNPRMQMYIFSDAGNPAYQPDSDFDNGIISHEYGHGWSIRLTGGPANVGCLANAESGGEGWSDYLGLMLTTDWSVLSPNLASANIAKGGGTYVKGQSTTGPGSRPFRYSYDMANVNPTVTYGQVANTLSFTQPHGIGSIWATVLWDMTWEIIFQDNQITNNIYDVPANIFDMKGNVAALKLVNEGLRLQSCSPSFVQARDAILQADALLFGSRYRCAISKAFTRRGLGAYASTDLSTNDRIVTEDFTPLAVPALTSTLENTICNNQLFNYTPTVGVSGTYSYTWTRAAVAGISNPASNGVGSIGETLINTTSYPIEVKYFITVSPSTCGSTPTPQTVSIIVNPSVTPIVGAYSICQNGTIPIGEGLKVPAVYINSIDAEIAVGPTYVRSNTSSSSYINSSVSVYYKSIPFTASFSEDITFEVTSASLTSPDEQDTHLSLYKSPFDPANPATNFLISRDDGGENYQSKFTHTLTKDSTYVLVVSTYKTATTGTFTLESSVVGFTGANNWYTTASGGTLLTTGELFNPVGVAGSGISNTSILGTSSFYVSQSSNPSCRTPVSFTISETQTASNVSVSSSAICPAANLSLTADCPSGEIKWYNQLSNGTSIGEGSNLVQAPISNTTFYVSCETATCKSARVATSTVIVKEPSATPLTLTTDYNSGSTLEMSSESILATNKVMSPAKAIYKSGKSISLNEGFEATSASLFRAEIGGCENIGTLGLVAYYPFNGNANDETENDNNGIVNGATLTTDRFGVAAKAYAFDGINDKISSNVGSSFYSEHKTISFWAKISGSGIDNPRMVGVGPAGSPYQYYSLILEGTASPRRIWFFSSNSLEQSFSATSVADNSGWHNYQVTFDGHKVKVFIDGVLDKETNTTGSLANFSNAVLQIGSSDNGLDPFQGSLDELRIYNRALSDAEVQAIYNAEKP